MALSTLLVLDRRWLLSCLYLHLGAGYNYSSQDISLRGVVVKTRFKRIEQLLQQSSKKSMFWIVPFWILHLRQRHLRSRSCSAISGAQRARRRGRLRDLGSPPRGSPAILKIELLKNYQKKPDCHSKVGFLTVKRAAHMTDVCLGPFLAHGVAPFLRFS